MKDFIKFENRDTEEKRDGFLLAKWKEVRNKFFGQPPAATTNFKEEKKDLSNYKKVIEQEKNGSNPNAGNGSAAGGKNEFKTPNPAKEEYPQDQDNVNERWRAPKILKTNLVKGEITTFIDWKKNLRLLGVNLLTVLIIILFVYNSLLAWEYFAVKRGEILTDELADLDKRIKLAEKEAEKIDVFYYKLRSTDVLLAKHVYWTNVIEFFEKNLLADMYISEAFNVKYLDGFNFKSRISNFNSLANQIRVLKADEKVREIEVNEGTLSRDETGTRATSLSFDLKIMLDPDIYYK